MALARDSTLDARSQQASYSDDSMDGADEAVHLEKSVC